MAYNLESLIKILDQILHPEDHRLPWIVDPCKRSHLISLLAKARFLKEYFEHPSSVTGHQVRSLELRIRDATYRAENFIESHLADQLVVSKQNKFEEMDILISPPDLIRVIDDHEIERILEDMVKIMDAMQFQMSSDASTSHLVSPTQDLILNPEKILVGRTEELNNLKERLLGQEQKQEIISIVGMGGIGKTFLARTLYEDKGVHCHFDIRAWAVVSQSYNMHEILLGLLKCICGTIPDEWIRQENHVLAERLYKKLFGRRYLIVLDDMWSNEAWNDLQTYFPCEGNRSRILVTSREQSVANTFGSGNLHHHIDPLSEIESWKLLCRKVFAKENCPQELEKVGKFVAKECRGLPLVIHVVGGVLSKLETSEEAWKSVANDVSSVADSDDHFLNILSLSYNHLPGYLKPCFLYMGNFSNTNYQIPASTVIRLWEAEGFLKPILGKSIEEAAQVFLKELVERNLLKVGKRENQRVKSYIMHDLLMELCVKKAREEKFFYAGFADIDQLKLDSILRMGRSVPASSAHLALESADNSTFITSLKLTFDDDVHHANKALPWLDFGGLRLLRVLDVLPVELPSLPKSVEKLFFLRYLAVTISSFSNLLPSISALGYLQTLIIHSFHGYYGSFPFEKIHEPFDVPQLRHMKFKKRYPLFVLDGGIHVARHENLQTLSTVAIDDNFPKFLEAAPNLKKLGIIDVGFISQTTLIDMTCLSKLQTLTCSSSVRWSTFLSAIRFPSSLKKLRILKCGIPLGYIDVIGNLPELEVLKLQGLWFGRQWEPTEGQFQKLKYLLLEDLNLVKWIADETNYPILECLIIRNCSQLEEIPIGIGCIDTLKIIELQGANSDSAAKSAREIQADQIAFGNEDLQVRITLV